MIGFPSIKQFTDIIRDVGKRVQYAGKGPDGKPRWFPYTVGRPKMKFRGTVKLHGSNAAVVYNVANDSFGYQSRENELTLEKDMLGFMEHMSTKEHLMRKIIDFVLPQQTNDPEHIAIFGEWCGGEVQPGFVLSTLPKMFCIFAIKVVKGKNPDGSNAGHWIDMKSVQHLDWPEERIYNTLRFGEWEMEIDFERPQIFQNDLADLTIAIETLCPAGKYFGIEGIGEGMVWICLEEGWDPYQFGFKVVGQKHAKTHRRELAQVDIEAVKALEDFVAATVTEARLQQGLHVLQHEKRLPFLLTSQGEFGRWVYNDIMKEEVALMEASNLEPKKLGAPISVKARTWYVEQLKAAGVL